MADNQYDDLVGGLAADARMTRDDFMMVVKQRCFNGGVASEPQLMLLLLIAKKYDLNPLVREIHAFLNPKRNNQMEIVVGIDGWIKIVTRDARFRGFVPTEIYDDGRVLVAVKMEMYRDDWKVPGTYTAQMSEWSVPSDPGKGPSNWEKYPSHRLFAKAFQECARFTFGITEIMDEDDAIRIERADEPIYQDQAAQPKVLEHQPREPMPIMPILAKGTDATNRVPAETQKGAAHVSEQAEANAAPVSADSSARAGAESEAIAVTSSAAIATPAETPPSATAPASAPGRDGDANGKPQRDNASAAVIASDGGAAQAAAGLEVVDPNEHPLEMFIRAHDVPKRRVDLQLAKYDVATLADLSAAQTKEVFAVFQRAYQGGK